MLRFTLALLLCFESSSMLNILSYWLLTFPGLQSSVISFKKSLKSEFLVASLLTVSQFISLFILAGNNISLSWILSLFNLIRPIPKALFMRQISSLNSMSSSKFKATKYPSFAQLELETTCKYDCLRLIKLTWTFNSKENNFIELKERSTERESLLRVILR